MELELLLELLQKPASADRSASQEFQQNQIGDKSMMVKRKVA